MTAEKAPRDTIGRFVDQMDATERFIFLQALYRMADARSNSWFTRRLHEFDDWYRERRGIPPRAPR